MHPLRLLVVEGNTPAGQARVAAHTGATPATAYAGVLTSLAADAAVDICCPADLDASLPDEGGLAAYDGVAFTGSALHVYDGGAEVTRQIELARAIFAQGVPFFGSCWGLQVATVAAGGVVAPNPRGRELAFARKITLTETGLRHPMHAGRAPVFDAPCVHFDEVAEPAPGTLVTAWNIVSGVQAAEIRHGNGVFWGVQYHPEYTLRDVAATVARYGAVLVTEGFFRDAESAERWIADIAALGEDPARFDLAWRYGLGQDVLDPAQRLTEIRNWLERLVRPAAAERGRR